ncbi:DgyrCDS6296 [Dimorphilus gyrociliatus]|uniref:DgyrCDS6296 n=1 Tax=Dimorphilus gyrociliatus TaxID=2664684 RepID=A0A7I8VP84_9ANNE|nr:DgyrCDS6296 [Dimorphilus gyrociliatus]
MAEEDKTRNNSVQHTNPPINWFENLQKYLMGNMEVLDQFLEDKPVLLQFPIWMLRATGAPIFVNNPLSGVFILAALFYSNSWVSVCALMSLVVAISTALLLNRDQSEISSGGITFNSMLTGIIVSSMIDKDDWYPWTIFPIVFLSFSCYGLNNIFSAIEAPALNLPFCVLSFIFIGSCLSNTDNNYFPIKTSVGYNYTDDLEWGKVFKSIVTSAAQIYGSDKVVCGVLVLMGLFVSSPIICLHAVLGVIYSSLVAVAIDAPPEEIYNGSWSYCALLTCASLGGFFIVLNIRTHILAITGACLSTIAFGALRESLKPLPVLAFPFVLTAVILYKSADDVYFKKIPLQSISYPEKHIKEYGHQNSAVSPIVPPV